MNEGEIADQLVNGEICSYKLTFPFGADEADKLIIDP